MGFNLADYEPVEDRLRAFWQDHADGRVLTELVESHEGRYVVKALIHVDASGRVAATGYAQETETERGVNSTSALENCETSAIGRALANLGYAPKGKRPSREEMSKASPAQSESPATATRTAASTARSERAPIAGGTSAPPAMGERTERTAGGSGSNGEVAPDPSAPHVHEWIPSPKLTKYEVCSVEGCFETKKKGAAA